MIDLENATKKYDHFDLNISLTLPKGKVSGIVGRNGAGKSTTIKLILGLIKSDTGTVRVFGNDPAMLSDEDKNNIGVTLAESGFSNYITITAVTKILKNMYRDFDEEKFIHDVKNQNLPLDKFLKDFSTGMKAKLRVLVALSHKADLLILDEPTSGLDVVARNEILDMLRNYIAENENRSILITSHISSDLEELCDDIYFIDDGKIIFHEDTDVLLGNYAVLKVSKNDFDALDKQYILKTKEERYGYECLTNERQYYIDNYPGIVIENSGIDNLIIMLSTK